MNMTFHRASDHVISKLTGRHIRAGRSLLGWTAQNLANASQVGVATIRRAEADDGQVKMIPANIAAIVRTLEEHGVVLIQENGGGTGARMAKPEGSA
jgi:predicted transcriptional regulator